MADPVWNENLTGRCPTELIGTQKRVAVKLRNGRTDESGWRAWEDKDDYRTRWTLTGHPADITHWRLIE